jgi:predicted transcriptional regulator
VVKVRGWTHRLLQADYKKRDLPELLYAVLTAVREAGKCRFTYLSYRVQTTPYRLYFYLKILLRSGYLRMERVGKRGVYITITDSGMGFTDDLREYLEVRRTYVMLHMELRKKLQTMHEGMIIE